MFLPRLALGALLLASPGLSRAQTATPEPAAAPKLYVGLAAFHSNFQNLGSWRSGDTGFRVPVQLSAGYQLRPRLALELGAAYSGRTARYAFDGIYVTAGGTNIFRQFSNTTTERAATVSALARYALTRQPAHRLQVAALGGFTLVHRSVHARGSDITDASGNLQISSFDIRSTSDDLLLTAGLGLGYRLTPRFALNLDLATNYNLNHSDTFDKYTGSAALGLRYRLGQR